jgi:hypothetical protein
MCWAGVVEELCRTDIPLKRGWPAGGRSGVFTLPSEKLSEARERSD